MKQLFGPMLCVRVFGPMLCVRVFGAMLCVRVLCADAAFPAVGVGPSRGVRTGCPATAGLREGGRADCVVLGSQSGQQKSGHSVLVFVENGLMNWMVSCGQPIEVNGFRSG